MKKAATSSIVFLMVLLLAAASAVAGVYACKCEGVQKRSFFFFTRTMDCGNGFARGEAGSIQKTVPDGQLFQYLSAAEVHKLKTTGCAGSDTSGWRCGKITGSGLPACLEE